MKTTLSFQFLILHLIRILLIQREQMEKFLNPWNSTRTIFSCQKASHNQRHQSSKWYLQIPGIKKIVETLRNLFQFFSILIEACLLEGLVCYRYLLKLQQERHESVMTSYLLALLLRLLSVSGMFASRTFSTPRCEWEWCQLPRLTVMSKWCSICKMLPLGAVLVHSGCCSKIPQTAWLINNRNLFLQFWKLKVWDQSPGMVNGMDEGSLLVVDLSFYPHMVEGVRELFRASCIRALISFRRAPPKDPTS